MAEFPVYEVDDLAHFANAPVELFTEFGEESLEQAVFLVQARTGIYQWPTDKRLQMAFKLAIMDIAVRLYYESFYMRYKAIPMQSETIGTYSYSKGNTADTTLFTARPTGIRWFDVLLDLLSRMDADLLGGIGVAGGGVHIFENEGVIRDGNDGYLPGPKSRGPERNSPRMQQVDHMYIPEDPSDIF